MKSIRLVLPVVSMLFSITALAQDHTHAPMAQAPKSEAQKSFARLKELAGSWEGTVTTSPTSPFDGKIMQVSLRVTSMGNALMHEMTGAGRPDDPITMLYMDEGRLLLTHYCDAGNRPRMVAKTAPDGNKVEFDFLDIAGNPQYGHMHHAVFTMGDADHHTEDWIFIEPRDKPVQVHLDLRRAK